MGLLDELNEKYNDLGAGDLEEYRLSLLSHKSDEDGIAETRSLSRSSGGCSRKRSTSPVESTRVLGADLPLLHYSTTMPILHAQRAEIQGATQEGVVMQLIRLDHKLWRRWRLLREDIHPECGLLEFVVEGSLKSWIDGLLCFGFDPFEALHEALLQSKGDLIDFLVQRYVDAPREPLLHRLLLSSVPHQSDGPRTRSVALDFLHHCEKTTEVSPDTVRLLVNTANARGDTPLQVALQAPDETVAALLIRLGADVNVQDQSDERPLLLACSSPKPLNIIKPPIQHGALVDIPKSKALTPLQLVCTNSEEGSAEAARILLLAGANVSPEGTNGRQPLLIACDKANPDIQLIQVLIDHGAPVNQQDEFGQTALHILCSQTKPSLEAITTLALHGGCGTSILDQRGRSAFHLACSKPELNAQVLKLLLGAGKSMLNHDNQGATSLHSAVRWSNREQVAWLIQQGARVDAVDSDGTTPIELALIRLFRNPENFYDIDCILIAHFVTVAAKKIHDLPPNLAVPQRALDAITNSKSRLIESVLLIDEYACQ